LSVLKILVPNRSYLPSTSGWGSLPRFCPLTLRMA
jgi:hypothetical protein